MKNTLEMLGFSTFFEQSFMPFQAKGFSIGRIAVENKNNYIILSNKGILQGELSGKLLFIADSTSDLPKVGDWVVMSVFEKEEKAVILEVLPRTSTFSRKVAGKKAEEQVIATNLDLIFIVQSLDQNYNIRRLERYLVMTHESGAMPVIILNKADLCTDTPAKVREVQKMAKEVPVIPISCVDNSGLDQLQPFMQKGTTIAFTGSSGVGKSTIINKLAGKEIQETGAIRQIDAKGRHTTTRRELIVLENGAILIDTPGMRELQLWNADEGLEDTFEDITQLASQCYFSNCKHTNELNCAILTAVHSGQISWDRYESYLKLQKELAYLDQKQNQKSYLAHKNKVKKMQKQANQIFRRKE